MKYERPAIESKSDVRGVMTFYGGSHHRRKRKHRKPPTNGGYH